jgi:NADPH:quinone reductase-like Zn-dependent oxidoreductase
MKAAVCRRYGPPDVIEIADVPRPKVGAKDVLIKVRATTVSAGDWRLRSFNVPRGFGILLPAFSLTSARPSFARGTRVSLHSTNASLSPREPRPNYAPVAQRGHRNSTYTRRFKHEPSRP